MIIIDQSSSQSHHHRIPLVTPVYVKLHPNHSSQYQHPITQLHTSITSLAATSRYTYSITSWLQRYTGASLGHTHIHSTWESRARNFAQRVKAAETRDEPGNATCRAAAISFRVISNETSSAIESAKNPNHCGVVRGILMLVLVEEVVFFGVGDVKGNEAWFYKGILLYFFSLRGV